MINRRVWLSSTPLFFVFLWSTGFIAAKYGLPYAPPMSFLILRCLGAVLILLPVVLLTGAAWPHGRIRHVALAGLLLQAGYLGGVWGAIKLGMPAGLSALIVGMQPILTAFAAPLIGEKVRPRQWLGLLLGLCGVGLVVAAKIHLNGLAPGAIALCVLALLSITAGTMYQKRFCPHIRPAHRHRDPVRGVRARAAAVRRAAGRLRAAPGEHPLDAAIRGRAAVGDPGAVDRRDLPAVPPHQPQRRHARDEPAVPDPAHHRVMAWLMFGESSACPAWPAWLSRCWASYSSSKNKETT
jgi:uncharacterized membrane protein